MKEIASALVKAQREFGPALKSSNYHKASNAVLACSLTVLHQIFMDAKSSQGILAVRVHLPNAAQ